MPILNTVNTLSRPADIAGYRTFVAIVAVSYFTLIALLPSRWGPVNMWQLAPLSVLYLALGIWGFQFAQRKGRRLVSLGYLLIEFAIGMQMNRLAHDGLLPLILLPVAAQAVSLLPRLWALPVCGLVIAGVSGNLTWVPSWPDWFRNLAIATAAVVFVVVYVGVAVREREARRRIELLSAEVADLAAANERNRLAREIHDTLGHYLTVIHVQLEAARAIVPTDPERGLLAITRAQTFAKDGLAAVRQSVKALRDNTHVESVAEQLRSLVEAVQDETLTAHFSVSGTERPLRPAVALALHRSALEAMTNVRRHAAAGRMSMALSFEQADRVRLVVEDNGVGAASGDGGGYGLMGLRERAEDLGGRVTFTTSPGRGFEVIVELPG